ncbi:MULTISPECIES: hypothetical protein [unclassified Rhizobium]|uniref:hypothetical protein n=1 Tax=unclassified Rhizobium TaxID=2613769 RepID=UPI002479CC4F|nr:MULTISPECIES: hypothetical protein [unclassified Rhizobium]MDH7803835.1 hypothetical protein [Rhizobium sp. AN70]
MTRHRKPGLKTHRADTPPLGIFSPSEIASDPSWVPDMAVLGEPAMTAETYIAAYLADVDAWWWSTNLHHEPRDLALKRTLAIITRAKMPDHERALGQLGVDPLENMMSDELLDLLRAWMPFTPAMCYALGCVRMEFEPPMLQHRLGAMIAESQRKTEFND